MTREQDGRGVDRSPFCAVAEVYDDQFTDHPLGRKKRALVHEVLDALVRKDDRLLELACGTGEDALHLADRVRSITLTDASPGMMARAIEKFRTQAPSERQTARVDFIVATIEKVAGDESPVSDKAPFDLIYSNFDGLNCVASIPDVIPGLYRLLRPGGRLVVVFMTRHNLFEKMADLLRGRFRRVVKGRAVESGEEVSIGDGATIRTWFPAVREVERAFVEAGFVKVERRAIGVTLPPTTMIGRYDRHTSLFRFLERFEGMLARLPLFDRTGDHVLLHLQRPEMCDTA